MGNVQAYILAGGKSQRFGSDKSRARLGGTTLIGRTIRFVEKLDLPLTVVADRPVFAGAHLRARALSAVVYFSSRFAMRE